MSKESQNFLQRAFKAYTNYNPGGANDNARIEAEERAVNRNQYLEDQFVDRLDPTKPERGVKPSLIESVVLGIDRNDFKDAGDRISIRNLKKTDVGEQAEALGLTIKPNSNESKLQRRVDRRKKENEYSALSTKNPDLDVTKLSDSQLTEEIRKSSNKLNEQETYGVVGPDGTRTNASVDGQIKLDQAAGAKALNEETIASSKATTRINQGTLDLARVNATNAQTQQEYVNNTDSYRYEDAKFERGLQRQYESDREDARFAANLETIKLQNAAEMERYEMMLQNDKEVRQGDSISDLMASLTMLGGAFLL